MITAIQKKITAALCLLAIVAGAQEKVIPCASTDYEAHLEAQGRLQAKQQFERWLAPKVNAMRQKRDGEGNVITLPVVVHVIHDGDEEGVSENIPYERILSQITVLNQDFGRMEGTPGHVEGNAGVDTGIRFCLAQQDPDGNPTNGIDRQNLGVANWNSMEVVDTDMKGATMWDPERYINIWVCRFGGGMAQVGGYAYFPEGSGLDGLELGESNAEIDGIVMSFKAFGSSDIFPATTYFPEADKGRSLSHEMGHFFGLRHIWGDENSCDATDYCDDTPPVTGVHFLCEAADTCPDDEFADMIENHMDYTPDVCKSIFTNGQKERMWAVLENAPRRIALTQSDACEAPSAGTEDHGLQYGLKLYPNPASDTVHLTASVPLEGYSYEIYDVLGSRVDTGRLDAGAAVNVARLGNGVYMVRVTGEGTSKAIRFVKQ